VKIHEHDDIFRTGSYFAKIKSAVKKSVSNTMVYWV
jgi:hypothetical protein